MSGRRSRRAVRRPRTVLIFGEDENDTKTLAAFIDALCPERDFRLLPQRRPPILIKDAKPADIPSRVQVAVAAINSVRVDSDVIAVFAHQDCDDFEPAHAALSNAIERAFASAGDPVFAATPAWEMETWLMQWPLAFQAHVPSWNSIEKLRGRHLGLIEDSKETLQALLGRAGGHREYRESDSPKIAELVREQGAVRSPEARSDSFKSFVARVDGFWSAQRTA